MITKINYAEIARELRKISRELVEEYGEDLDSYAYFRAKENNLGRIVELSLIDICMPDYLCELADTMVSLPFNGYGSDLERELVNNLL